MKTIERINSLFPGAAPYEDVLDEYCRLLTDEYGVVSEETISAYSLCPDELNNPVVEKIRELFGHTFALGGIRITSYNVCYTKLLRSDTTPYSSVNSRQYSSRTSS